MKFGIWNSLYLLGEASRDRMVTLSSRQPLTLHHLGSSQEEIQTAVFRLHTLQSLHGELAQLSRNPVLLVAHFF